MFLAEDTWIDKKVALKVPHRQTLDFGELLHEPRLLATLSHPNIVTVLTAERIGEVFFIVMEYVPGETLEAISDCEGALELAKALDYSCQICNAVDHAHGQGSSTGTCGPATSSSPRTASPRWPTSAPRGSSRSPLTAPR